MTTHENTPSDVSTEIPAAVSIPIEEQAYEERLISIHDDLGFFPHNSDEMSMIVGYMKKVEHGVRQQDAFNSFMNQVRGSQELHTTSDDPNRALRAMTEKIKRIVDGSKFDYTSLEEDVWGLSEDLLVDYGPGFILADHPDTDLWQLQGTTHRGFSLLDRFLTLRRGLNEDSGELPKLSELGTVESIQNMWNETTAGDVALVYGDVVQEVRQRQLFWMGVLDNARRHLAVKNLIE